MTEALLAAVGGSVWITETGGLVRQLDGRRAGRTTRSARGRAWPTACDWPRRTPTGSSDCTSTSGRPAAHEPWDSGLIRPDFSPRPSFTELAAWLHPPAPPPLSVLLPPSPLPASTVLQLVRRPWFDPAAGSCARVSTARPPRRGRAPRVADPTARPRPPAPPASASGLGPRPRSSSGSRRGSRRLIRLRRTTAADAVIRAGSAAAVRRPLPPVKRAARAILVIAVGARLVYGRGTLGLRRGVGARVGRRTGPRRAAEARRCRAHRRRIRSRSSSRRCWRRSARPGSSWCWRCRGSRWARSAGSPSGSARTLYSPGSARCSRRCC